MGDGVEFADRNPAAHAIGLGALVVGRQIAHAEPANWGSPGIPRSVGPFSSSGFTRCSGVSVTQPLSEGKSEVTPALSSRRGKRAKKGNRSRCSSSSSDSSRGSRRDKRHRGDSLSRADFMEAFQALAASLTGRLEQGHGPVAPPVLSALHGVSALPGFPARVDASVPFDHQWVASGSGIPHTVSRAPASPPCHHTVPVPGPCEATCDRQDCNIPVVDQFAPVVSIL